MQMINAENDNLHEYEVWMEGYAFTGNSSPHMFIGRAVASSFQEACEIALRAWCNDMNEFNMYYDSDKCTFWGCRCYDNEADAAKSFG